MPAYVTLFNWTEQGLQTAKNTAKRAKDAEAAWEAVGARFIGIWWTLGQYDGIFIHEAPDEKTAIQLLMKLGLQGNIRTTTMRAFGEEEIDSITQGLP